MGVSRAAGDLLLGVAASAAAVGARLWAALWSALRAIGRLPPLARLRDAIARLPPFLALPLFLVPELCSRSGWVASVWLLLVGHPGRAMAVYVATKVVAGGSALWIYAACEPALLRIPPFAAMHAMAGRWRRTVLDAARAWPPVARLRARRAAPGFAAAAPPPTAAGGRTE